MKPARIVRTPGICGGLPRIDGTRIETRTIYYLSVVGYDTHHIMGEFPSLTSVQIEAALRYEKRLLRRVQRVLAAVLEAMTERMVDRSERWR